MIRLETRPAFINHICNSDDVRPWIDYRPAMSVEMDFTEACDPESGIVFLSNDEDALGCFCLTGPREYQVHTFFGAMCRGRKAIQTAKEMVAWMMPTYCDCLWGATPLANRKARWFNRQCGFNVVGYDVYEAEGPVEIVERVAW